MKNALKEYDVVRVIRLSHAGRPYGGNNDVARPPQIGDIGTIVHDYGHEHNLHVPVCVESVDKDGYTVWIADFFRDELEFIRI